jgi:hypothetical protein
MHGSVDRMWFLLAWVSHSESFFCVLHVVQGIGYFLVFPTSTSMLLFVAMAMVLLKVCDGFRTKRERKSFYQDYVSPLAASITDDLFRYVRTFAGITSMNLHYPKHHASHHHIVVVATLEGNVSIVTTQLV